MNDVVIIAGTALLYLLPGAFVYLRARRELEDQTSISNGTFVAAFIAYAGLGAGVSYAAWNGAWPLPIDPPVATAAGTILLAAGFAVHLGGRLEFSFRTTWGLEMSTLVTSGIYRLIRHPQNLGWGLILTGVALLGASGGALALAVMYVVSCFVWLPVEEKVLERRYGPAYAAYRTRTPAIIPFVKLRLRRPSPG